MCKLAFDKITASHKSKLMTTKFGPILICVLVNLNSKHSMIVIYDSKLYWLVNWPKYDFRVINYVNRALMDQGSLKSRTKFCRCSFAGKVMTAIYPALVPYDDVSKLTIHYFKRGTITRKTNGRLIIIPSKQNEEEIHSVETETFRTTIVQRVLPTSGNNISMKEIDQAISCFN